MKLSVNLQKRNLLNYIKHDFFKTTNLQHNRVYRKLFYLFFIVIFKNK